MFKCKVCEVHEQRISDLKQEIARLVHEKDNERAEFKRAIDVLLHEKQLPIVGQGVQTAPTTMSLPEMLAYMDEEVPAPAKG